VCHQGLTIPENGAGVPRRWKRSVLKQSTDQAGASAQWYGGRSPHLGLDPAPPKAAESGGTLFGPPALHRVTGCRIAIIRAARVIHGLARPFLAADLFWFSCDRRGRADLPLSPGLQPEPATAHPRLALDPFDARWHARTRRRGTDHSSTPHPALDTRSSHRAGFCLRRSLMPCVHQKTLRMPIGSIRRRDRILAART
jgi:hypothetical protein